MPLITTRKYFYDALSSWDFIVGELIQDGDVNMLEDNLKDRNLTVSRIPDKAGKVTASETKERVYVNKQGNISTGLWESCLDRVNVM